MDTFVEPVVPATEPSATGLAPAEPAPAVTAAAPAGKVVDIGALTEAVARESGFVDQVVAEVGKIVVGQAAMIERILIGLLTGGHCLIEGVPGLAKTLTVKTLARSIRASFQRIQFTPDLLPADITGTIIYNMHSGEFTQKRGPLFANLVLADEINRAPAKVQSALLEVMAEGHVSIGGTTYQVPDPFLVLATQNPIESEGVYPLPEAQRDRFLMKVLVDYPNGREEAEIVRRMGAHRPVARPVLDPTTLRALQDLAADNFVHDAVLDYAVRLVLATREPERHGVGDLAPLIAHGVSPRGTLGLVAAGRALALIRGRRYVLPQDIYDVARDVLRHRVLLTFEAVAEGVQAEAVVERVVSTVVAPRVSPSQDGPIVHEAVGSAA